MRAPVLVLLALLCGCESTHHMTTCRGTFAAANPGKWQPTAGDLGR
jgi:hypothetical protein